MHEQKAHSNIMFCIISLLLSTQSISKYKRGIVKRLWQKNKMAKQTGAEQSCNKIILYVLKFGSTIQFHKLDADILSVS